MNSLTEVNFLVRRERVLEDALRRLHFCVGGTVNVSYSEYVISIMLWS